MEPAALAALAEPNRLRIVELLRAAPRPVGEVATELGLRQPQATKHLQALERAGLVSVHPLGRRRIYALRRDGLGDLRAWLDDLGQDGSDEATLSRYAEAVAAEQRDAQRDPRWAVGRTVQLRRAFSATPAAVWSHWTSARRLGDCHSPEHFTVAECEVEPVAGGRMRVVFAEGDGTRHASEGRVLEADRPRHLRFALAPVGPDGRPLFSATHDLRLRRRGRGTTALELDIVVTDARPEAAPALAGMEIGWGQSLAKLGRLLGVPEPEDVTFEPLGLRHAALLQALAADPDVQRFTRVPAERPAGFAEQWARRYEEGRAAGEREGFAVRWGDDLVGVAVAPHLDAVAAEVELGYMVAPEHRGRGHATRMLRRLTRWAFEDAGALRAYLQQNHPTDDVDAMLKGCRAERSR